MKNFIKGLTLPGKFIVALVLFGAFYGLKMAYDKWYPKPVKESQLIAVNDLPPLAYDKTSSAPLRMFADTNNVSDVAAPFEIRAELMGWNGQTGVLHANGGALTMQNSIMEENGVKLRIICQNNCTKQGEDIFAFAQEYAKGNKNSSKGCHMIAWMGDGVPSYLAGLNDLIKKQIGPDYIIQAFAAFGNSFGEDKAIFENGSFKQDPQRLRGSLWIGVLRDGDWNILMKYADMNQIPVNNDPTTYDPEAINWMATDDYVKAAQQYVSRVKETRPIVIKGKRTGRDTTITVNGCVTWFPGDKVAFEGRGGVTVASTKDFGAQMANVWLAPKKFLEDNRAYVEKFILAASLGGDQIKSHSTALTFASKISSKVYGDASMSASDWESAFKGIQMTDAQGNINEVGGSRVFNLADQAEYFGLNGGTDKYNAVYTTFGDLCVKAYPEIVSSYPPYDEVVDLSYVSEVYRKNKNNKNMTTASVPTFKEGETMSQLVSSKSVTIEFEFGSANISPKSNRSLQELSRDLIIAENLLVTINGHTDNVGNSQSNKNLSQQRADAVKYWLLQQNSKAFKNKITTYGFGDENPVASNNSDAGRQKNRRVEIKFGR